MNPKLPLQVHLKFLCNENNLFDAHTINRLLERWKEDYDLVCEIQTNNKCQICDDDLHWIHKLNCPQKVYAEAFKFKRLYETLQKTVEIAKCNKDYIAFFDSYVSQSENPELFSQWANSVMNHKSNIDELRFELLNDNFFITDKNEVLQKVRPILGNDFDFEFYIEPKHFLGIFKLIKLIAKQSKYN
ncbi:hypothetical protein DI487_10285 [Flavobacterium sediminis]|uniref:Uncharacterized protein n=1 Tax=Flavobacterium sediminis TaxID=2201181 RepID=A0A2U8QVH0_9FLAO|nr:hypothetical protein [Flavobacterium sediminis]AWM14200.1 hypothetical protein DI487_10285 [Flavobacterium sediminis]